MRVLSLFLIPGLLAAGCRREEPAPPAAPAAAASVPAAAPADFSAVAGRWQRTDGDYALVLKDPAADGSLTAAYFNPNPIHVSKAEVRATAGGVNVFVELRDANYPGCTYTLTYRPGQDLLAGVYFQAQLQEQYEVAFQRVRP